MLSEGSISSDIDTEELEAMEQERDMDKGNGFVYVHDINTYRKTKREKLDEEKAKRDDPDYKKTIKKRRESKKKGKTNIEQARNKPMNMMLPKKVRQ